MTTTTGPSTTRWARCGCPPTRCGARRPSVRSRTSRSAGPRSSRGWSVRWPWSSRRPPAPTGGSACVDRGAGRRDRGGRRQRRGGRAPRPLPRRRLPDRVRHQLQHEHERGARQPRRPRRHRRPPQRPRQRQPVEQRHVPDRDPRRRRAGGRRGPPARARRPPRQPARQGRGVRRAGEVGPHPPDGRDAGDARPGARRVRRHAGARAGAARRGAPPGPGAAARRHRGRHRHQHARRASPPARSRRSAS